MPTRQHSRPVSNLCTDDPNTFTVCEAVNATVQHSPGQVSLRDAHGSYTFLELLHHWHGVSKTLMAHHVAPGDRVALLLNQGKAAVAAMLGVLEAGACFVPIDVREPADRLQYILNDCQPRVLLTDSANEPSLRKSLPDSLILSFDAIGPCELPETKAAISPDSMACIFYTSGSTGNPKGVCQNHRNFLHFANTYAARLGIHAGDRLSMLFSMNFSASNMNIFAGLLRGAIVCFYDLKHRGSGRLERWFEDENITILHTVPSVFRHLLGNTSAGHVYGNVRAIDLGGEPGYSSDVGLLKTFFTSECKCFNHLGATEASVIAQHRIDTAATYARALLPVGPPANGMNITVINALGENAAIDEVGEIILESDFLSTGYWNRPELTEKAFFLSSNGRRCYRSGDLGFLDGNGELNCVGRNDFRVKINGQSVDLGEIEACLLALPEVDEAVVAAHRPHAGAENVLAAFLHARSGPVSSFSLRNALKDRLPAFMIPSHLIWRDSFPRTSTGKIDRRKLVPEPQEITSSEAGIDSPVTDLEKDVGLIFSSLLKTGEIDRSKTFFEQGGDSLKAMNLVILLEKHHRVNVPLELLQSNASVANIAQYLQNELASARKHKIKGSATTSSLMVPLKVHERPRNLFLVHGRQGHAMVSPQFRDLVSADYSLYALRAKGLKQGERPNLSIEGMASDYIGEIRQVQNEGPYFLSGLCVGSIVALEMARQLTRQGEIVKPVMVFDPPSRPANWISNEGMRLSMRSLYQSLYSNEVKASDCQGLAKDLERHARNGKIDLDLGDEQALVATYRVILGVNIAINTYLPHPYEGEVLILCSTERFEQKRRFGDTLITGKMTHFLIGQTHNDVLNPKHPEFIQALQKCMELLKQ